MDWTYLGLVAGLLTTAGYVPQLIKGYRTKRMDDVSLLMPMVLGAGMLLWLAYGVVLDDFPIIMWNAVASILNVGIIMLKITYTRKSMASGGAI